MNKHITNRFPGMACAYMDVEGKEIWESYGVADKETTVLVDEDTVFPACSISKFITAICVLRLQEQNVIDIDKPVNDYLQRWKLRTLNESESTTTIRALLCHTSGIVDGEDGFYGHRRDDEEIRLIEILEGKTSYNNRPARVEQPQETMFEYSDSGFCVIQLLLEEVTGKKFEDIAANLIFDKLCLKNTFFGTRKNINYYEQNRTMATGYQGGGLPISGKYPICPDLAASGLWSTPKELLIIAKDFLASLNGEGRILSEQSVREMIRPVEQFPWVGLGLFLYGEDTLVSKGWGENGQCMLKMNISTHEIGVVMANQDPQMPQEESGIECMVERKW